MTTTKTNFISTPEQYVEQMNQSIADPDQFWTELAEKGFNWLKKWDKVSDFNFEKGQFSWFEGAQLNITENCIDRHLKEGKNTIAYIFEPNNPNESIQKITYAELHTQVCKMANVLRSLGVEKGDRVCVYLPMIPELVYSVLACARIGAVHSVVFAGFSSNALQSRINDCGAKVVVTADGGYRGEKKTELKEIVDDALKNAPTVEKVLVVERINSAISLFPNRDLLLQPLMLNASKVCEPEVMNSEDPLFILYTSGSTGKPKGMVHTCGGYMVYVGYSFKNVFQYEKGDIYWCTADIGWITGHSYIVYGPLLNGATSVLFEGIPSFPDCSRFWQVVEKHQVNQLYTAPTAIRALAKESLDFVKPFEMKSLKVLGSVGEPINEEAWHWYNENVGNFNCPIVDTWWQTETGGILISPIPNATP
ncbi:MAG: AMP-binding protein, partial [Bacteroidetes bacterium]|nr:AMP-binding protein [Bacteroidota bacterium]